MKDLNAHEHGIVLDVLPFTNLLNRSKFDITVSFIVTRCCGPLERQQIRFCDQGLANVMTKLRRVRLIQDGKCNSSCKGPLQDRIVISLHHVNEQCHVFSHATIYTV